MAGLDDSRSVASELAAERFRLATELAVAGKSPYPDGAAFVASDMPIWVPSSLATHVSADR